MTILVFLAYSKRKTKSCRLQQPSTFAEHVADSPEGTFTSDVQEAHNTIEALPTAGSGVCKKQL
ncbi:hypothetical protein EYF80_037333 [Liparis tanakae]|uniref:Uncharacterized protein n=1 Tax=Liparis tanakae TaxID=230148 RepID=A0A4Z2GI59_9TELE|nr:hypothetical protein EYF80_037333 [Liparis tanakae]